MKGKARKREAWYLGMGEGAELLNAFEALAVPSTDFQLRVATAYCLHANALGYGEDALDIAERARSQHAPGVEDHLQRRAG